MLDAREVAGGLHILVDGAVLHVTLDDRMHDFRRLPRSRVLPGAKYVFDPIVSVRGLLYVIDMDSMEPVLQTYRASGCTSRKGLLAFRSDSVVCVTKPRGAEISVREVYRVNSNQENEIQGVCWLTDQSIAVVFEQRVEIVTCMD